MENLFLRAPGKKGNSPLHNAVYQNDITTVRNILAADISGINTRNGEGLTPLFAAVSRLNLDISNLLLQFGADPNIPRPEDAYTPLHVAAENGSDFLGELLLDHKAEINARNSRGSSPLIAAVQSMQQSFAAMLIRRNADPGIADKNGKTAADYAKEAGMSDLALPPASAAK